MIMFDDLTKRKKVIIERLIACGFAREGDCFLYDTEICGGKFLLKVRIDLNGRLDTDLIEKETGEEYILYKTDASGAFVGSIRTAIEQVLSDIVRNCYRPAIFKTAQAQMVIEFIRETFGDEPEFLWDKFPDNAVWRRKDNKKWYGAILTTSGKKIGLDTDKVEEIIDLRMPPAEAEAFLSRDHYYPGWHMNKKSWYTLILNGSISDAEIKKRIRESFDLAAK